MSDRRKIVTVSRREFERLAVSRRRLVRRMDPQSLGPVLVDGETHEIFTTEPAQQPQEARR